MAVHISKIMISICKTMFSVQNLTFSIKEFWWRKLNFEVKEINQHTVIDESIIKIQVVIKLFVLSSIYNNWKIFHEMKSSQYMEIFQITKKLKSFLECFIIITISIMRYFESFFPVFENYNRNYFCSWNSFQRTENYEIKKKNIIIIIRRFI